MAAHPKATTAEIRRTQVSQGGRPRVTEYTTRKYLTLRQTGYVGNGHKPMSQADAAEHAGISVATGRRIEQRTKFSLKKLLLPPAPIAYDALGKDAKRALADFNYFRVRYKDRDALPWAGYVGPQLLELYHSGEDHYVLFNVFPGGGKSTLLTDDFVEWAVLYERAYGREITCLLGHRTQSISRRYVRRIRQSFTNNHELLQDFGRCKPDVPNITWNEDELVVEPLEWDSLTEKDPTIAATSQEAGFIGTRSKILIFDDLVDKHNSRTEEAREDLVNLVETEAETRVNTPGLFVISGARYGPEDLFHNRAQLISLDEFEEGRPKKLYTQIKWPAHWDEKCRGEHGPWTTKEEAIAHAWPNGCLTDPTRAPWRKVSAFKSRNDGRFRLVWQQEDTDPEGSLADPKWFDGGTDAKGWESPGCFDHFRMWGQLPDREDRFRPIVSAVTLDPAGSGYWAMTHWLVYSGRLIYAFRGIRRRMDAPDVLYRQIDGAYTGYLEEWRKAGLESGVPFRYFIAEKNSTQRWLTQYEFMRTWFSQNNVVLIPHETSWNKKDPDKGVHTTVGPAIREGRLRLPLGGYEERLYSENFKREAVGWPEASTSDQVMHFWFLMERLDNLIGNMMAEAAEDEVLDTNVPSWAAVRAPSWAAKRLGGIERERVNA